MNNATLSPMALLQERLPTDGHLYPWRLLVACIALNQSKGDIVDTLIDEVFRRWPDPEAMAGADLDEMATLLRPCGLNRIKSLRLVEMSKGYYRDGPPADPRIFSGCGPYAFDSWRIFVLEDFTPPCPKDKRLAAYWRWRTGRDDESPADPPRRVDAREIVIAALAGGTQGVHNLRPRPNRTSIRRAVKRLREEGRGDVADLLSEAFLTPITGSKLPKVGECQHYSSRPRKKTNGSAGLVAVIPVDVIDPDGRGVTATFGKSRIVLEGVPDDAVIKKAKKGLRSGEWRDSDFTASPS